MAIVDKVIPYRSFNSLYVLLIGILTFSIFEIIMSVFKEYLTFHTELRITSEALELTQRKVFQKTLAFFKKHPEGDIFTRFQSIKDAQTFIIETPIKLAVDCMFGIVFIIILFSFSLSLTSLILCFCPIFGVFSWLSGKLIRPYLAHSFELSAARNSRFMESISDIHTIKSMNMEGVVHERLVGNSINKVKNDLILKKIEMIFFVLSKSSEKLLIVLIWFLGVKAVLLNELTLGQYMVFNMFIGRVTSPIMALMKLGKDLKTFWVNIEKAEPLFSGNEEVVFGKALNTPLISKGEISFQNVDFAYEENDSFALKNINLHIKSGEIIGVSGSNGSGKTTFSKLIQTLYAPTSGDIFIDGYNTRITDVYKFRKNIGSVLQNSTLFDATIMDNIKMMSSDIPDETVITVAQNIGAHEFISKLPDGYMTRVGFRGSALSGGQRQLITLARALILNPKILILDEATSNLDFRIEENILNNFQYITQDRTVIIIAHNPKLFEHADRILSFEQGSITEIDMKAVSFLHKVESDSAKNIRCENYA
jgi:ATP-binding cassette, subfamily B, bacterial HlyB/CyaB